MAFIESFCCIWNLRTGTIVTALITMLGAFTQVLLLVMRYIIVRTEEAGTWSAILMFVADGLYGLVIVISLALVMSAASLSRKAFMPWMVVNILSLIYGMISLICILTDVIERGKELVDLEIAMICIFAVYFVFEVYGTACVASEYYYLLKVEWDEEFYMDRHHRRRGRHRGGLGRLSMYIGDVDAFNILPGGEYNLGLNLEDGSPTGLLPGSFGESSSVPPPYSLQPPPYSTHPRRRTPDGNPSSPTTAQETTGDRVPVSDNDGNNQAEARPAQGNASSQRQAMESSSPQTSEDVPQPTPDQSNQPAEPDISPPPSYRSDERSRPRGRQTEPQSPDTGHSFTDFQMPYALPNHDFWYHSRYDPLSSWNTFTGQTVQSHPHIPPPPRGGAAMRCSHCGGSLNHRGRPSASQHQSQPSRRSPSDAATPILHMPSTSADVRPCNCRPRRCNMCASHSSSGDSQRQRGRRNSTTNHAQSTGDVRSPPGERSPESSANAATPSAKLPNSCEICGKPLPGFHHRYPFMSWDDLSAPYFDVELTPEDVLDEETVMLAEMTGEPVVEVSATGEPIHLRPASFSDSLEDLAMGEHGPNGPQPYATPYILY